jgi:hypothetical protein
MKKLFVLLCAVVISSCSKDDNGSGTSGISALIDGVEIVVPNNRMGYAVSNGTSAQVNGYNSSNEGFLLFFPVGTTVGMYGLDTASISVIYVPDNSSSKNYKLRKGILEITSISTTPTSVNSFAGSFSGWAFNNFNSSDSVEVTDGSVGFRF